jgi:hypothetical protein
MRVVLFKRLNDITIDEKKSDVNNSPPLAARARPPRDRHETTAQGPARRDLPEHHLHEDHQRVQHDQRNCVRGERAGQSETRAGGDKKKRRESGKKPEET